MADNAADSLFLILTGTLTCSGIDFLQLPTTDSLIIVTGNGTMTLLDCTFGQRNAPPASASALQRPLVLVNNSDALCHFEGCAFRNVTVEDSSALWIVSAKRISFVRCGFYGIVSTAQEEEEERVGGGRSSNRRRRAVLEAGGAITSNARELTILASSFTQCATARNGGAIYFGVEAGLSLTEVTFDRNTAGGYGGALYISLTNTSSARRYLARCQFQNNVARVEDDVGGNDIRDVAATANSWTGANTVDCCSISDPIRFSVGDNALDFEQYLPGCYNNPCLNHTVADCPLECDNSSGVDCITDNCTRVHHETTCSVSCRMYNDNCVPDRCFELKDEDTCLADHECYWDYPSSITLSTGEQIVDPNTKVCQAIGECTRQRGETNCTLPACILDRSDYCVTNKCYANVTSAAECAQDCDWLVDDRNAARVTCKATNCTRQGRETECPVEVGNCLLEDAGEYVDRCTTNVCFGLTQDECTAECQWWNGTCQTHACTRLHNETACSNGCVEDGRTHCIPADCGQRVPRTWEVDYLCGPLCFLDPLAPTTLGKQCVAACPKDDRHTGEGAEGKCVLTQPCADRIPGAIDGTYPCGTDCLYDPAGELCGTECPKDSLHTGGTADGKCVVIPPCADRIPEATEGTYPCGADCLYDPAVELCGTECPKDSLHTGGTVDGKCVVILPCADRKPETTEGAYPCGANCLYDPVVERCGTECPKDEQHTGSYIDGKCVLRVACDRRIPNLAEYYYCGDDCFYDLATGTCVAVCASDELHTGESDSHNECVPRGSDRGGGDENPPKKSKTARNVSIAVIASVVGLLLLIIAVLVIVFVLWRKKKKEKEGTKSEKDMNRPIAINDM